MSRQENLVLPLRGYQRHCLAVAYHQVSPQVISRTVSGVEVLNIISLYEQ